MGLKEEEARIRSKTIRGLSYKEIIRKKIVGFIKYPKIGFEQIGTIKIKCWGWLEESYFKYKCPTRLEKRNERY